MRLQLLLAAATMASPAIAQVPTPRPPAAPSIIMRRPADIPRVGIGVTTTSGTTSRDTLGVLVAEVRAGSPAEKAGIEEGNRISSINGVSLRLAAADVGEPEMAGIMSRRLTRELAKLKAGDDVDLRVYANGQTRSIKVKTVAPESFVVDTRRPLDERATLGLDIGLTGSARDSLGVFVMGVEDNGPAAKAGIEEGSRIAQVNGVDLRAKQAADEDVIRSNSVVRLEREMAKIKPGDDVDLRVYFNGQYRNIKVKSVRAGDLPRHGRTIRIMSGDNMMMPAIPPMPPMPEISERLRRSMEEMRVALPRVEELRMAMPRVMIGGLNRVVW